MCSRIEKKGWRRRNKFAGSLPLVAITVYAKHYATGPGGHSRAEYGVGAGGLTGYELSSAQKLSQLPIQSTSPRDAGRLRNATRLPASF